MAALKLIITALVALFAVQSVTANGFDDSINKMLAYIDTGVTGLTHTFEDVVSKVSGVANSTVNTVGGHIDVLFGQISDLQKNAAAKGKSISECAAPNKALIAQTRDKAGAAARACVEAGIASAKAAIADSKEQLADLKPKAQALVQEWKACTAWDLVCDAKVLTKVAVALSQSALEIANVTTHAALQFGPILYHTGTCTAGILPDVTKSTAAVMKNLFDCANQTLSG